jgi:hypothetical protein
VALSRQFGLDPASSLDSIFMQLLTAVSSNRCTMSRCDQAVDKIENLALIVCKELTNNPYGTTSPNGPNVVTKELATTARP